MLSLANTHLLASVAVSGILAPNLYLHLRKTFYEQHQQSRVEGDLSTWRATVSNSTVSHGHGSVAHDAETYLDIEGFNVDDDTY